jgi:hypothetical protein
MTEALSLRARLFMDEDGAVYPVTEMLDCNGDETNDPCAAVTFVAGANGKWIAARVCDFPHAGAMVH